MTDIKSQIDWGVGGGYQTADGRSFWIDGTVAQEITRRVMTVLDTAVAEERERCAKIADAEAEEAAERIAAAIRKGDAPC